MSIDLLTYDDLPLNLLTGARVAVAYVGPPEKGYKLTLGTAALRNVGTTAGTVAAGDDSRIVGAIQKVANATAGNMAVLNADGSVGDGGAPPSSAGTGSGGAPVTPVQVTSAGSFGSPNVIPNTHGLLVRVAVSPVAASFFSLPSAATVGTIVTVKDELKNADLYSITISAPSGTVDGGTTFVISDPGATVQFQLVAAGVWESVGGLPASATVNGLLDFLITFGAPGKPSASAKIGVVPLTRAITLPSSAGFAAATAIYASAAATSATAFVLAYVRSGTTTSIGTYTVGAGSTSGAWSGLTVPTLQASDALIMTAPATPDATLADFCLVLQATKQ